MSVCINNGPLILISVCCFWGFTQRAAFRLFRLTTIRYYHTFSEPSLSLPSHSSPFHPHPVIFLLPLFIPYYLISYINYYSNYEFVNACACPAASSLFFLTPCFVFLNFHVFSLHEKNRNLFNRREDKIIL